MRLAVVVAAVLSLARAAGAQTTTQPSDNDPKPNPGRPTVSAPASLVPVGYLQFENGAFFARHSGEFSSQLSFNQVTKLAVTSRVELIAQLVPYARTTTDGQHSNNFGGFGGAVQVLLMPGDGPKPAIAASYSHSINGGGAASIDIGSANQTVVVLVSSDYGPIHTDVNLVFNQQQGDSATKWQNGQTLSTAGPIGAYTLAVELWRFSQPLDGTQCAGLLLALSRPVGKTIVVDAGFNRGLTRTSTRWEFFGGFTYLLPHRLWRP